MRDGIDGRERERNTCPVHHPVQSLSHFPDPTGLSDPCSVKAKTEFVNTGAAKQLQDFSEKNLQVTSTSDEIYVEVTSWTCKFGWTALNKSIFFSSALS